MEGSFWSRPSPDQAVFAPPGTAVGDGDTVALVEVMKTFTPIRAPGAGTVVAWVVRDGDGVEAGALLGWLRPRGS